MTTPLWTILVGAAVILAAPLTHALYQLVNAIAHHRYAQAQSVLVHSGLLTPEAGEDDE